MIYLHQMLNLNGKKRGEVAIGIHVLLQIGSSKLLGILIAVGLLFDFDDFKRIGWNHEDEYSFSEQKLISELAQFCLPCMVKQTHTHTDRQAR